MRRRHVAGATLLVVLWLPGCESRAIPLVPSVWSNRLDEGAQHRLVHAAYTTHYAQTRSEESLAFLLFNGVRSGMKRSDVEKVLGQPLAPVEAPIDWRPTQAHEDGDELLGIEPTNLGWSCLFHFRAGTLLNYYPVAPDAPRQIAEPPAETSQRP